MNINLLNNKRVAILGLGLENLALINYILKHKIKCEITVCDAREDVKAKHAWIPACAGMTRIGWQLGKNYNKNLDKFDILFRSPGWPMSGAKSTNSPMRLFFELSPSKNIIGVTGTKGKGTTASLIYEILRAAGKRVWLGGNIGVAPFDFIDKIKKTDWVVLELSSFQLEDMTVSPHIAVITNFYSEHLAPADPNNPNYHKSLKDYRDAKLNIIRWQRSGDEAVLNYKLNVKAKKVYFKKSELPSKLIGEHNKENIAAAVEVAKIVGVKPEIINKTVASFKGLEHRLELVREYQGIKYYDDSFATTPESTMIALKSFNQPVIILLGGADKKSDFSQLAEEVKKRCKFVVLLNGQATPKIKKELLKIKFAENKMKLVNNIKDAVAVARRQAETNDIILLSTACASFGMFKNYKERGRLFKVEVKSLK
ncbi:MAG: UDP-N-acetylmuramoyl-L-alanine--D-glutamate ligase [bacterium]|nr:UDP-N-acetylmuramoyl-L-alanine--D-glutamate ligase [bacterium]